MELAMGTKVYKVGEEVGWNNCTKVNDFYSQWSASKYFQVGDVLVFRFNPSNDNVFRVTAEDFTACTAPSPIGLPTDGIEAFTLDTPGPAYFICSIPGRCQAGQKLQVFVHSNLAPAPSPSQLAANQPQLPPAPAPSPVSLQQQQQSPPLPPPSTSPIPPPGPAPSSDHHHSPEQSPSDDKKSGSASLSLNAWVAVAAALALSLFNLAGTTS
ncbi:unnamed protein product [Cuscuta epithymum]|uniref:Phytocyanin domain-containing protein n=1 Tax=Cuscuta epithymum TaxID=186058 RepID=A0AAV0EYK5_9ASTE|nr:unnamed protein product [Cuscuta epithymum]